MKYDRRKFIEFLGKASLGALIVPPFLVSCGNTTTPIKNKQIADDTFERLKNIALENLAPTTKDDLVLTKGLNYHTIIKWGDSISDNDTFGFNKFICLTVKNIKLT